MAIFLLFNACNVFLLSFLRLVSVLRLFFLAVVPVFSTSKTPVYFDFIVTKKLYSFFITSGFK